MDPRAASSYKGGEYDFLQRLDGQEVARLRRSWMRNDPLLLRPDQLHHPTRPDASVDETIEAWLEATRVIDATSCLQEDRLPSPHAYGGLNWKQFTGDTGYDTVALFGPMSSAIQYLRERRRGEVLTVLAGESTDPQDEHYRALYADDDRSISE